MFQKRLAGTTNTFQNVTLLDKANGAQLNVIELNSVYRLKCLYVLREQPFVICKRPAGASKLLVKGYVESSTFDWAAVMFMKKALISLM